jgi:preprotein translocase subunit SecG
LLFTLMIVFHTLVCVLLMIVILMQSSKGEGLAGAFGGGGGLSGAVFGGRGAATFLSKATTVLAIVFFVNCGVLAFMSSNRHASGSSTEAHSIVTEQAQKEMEEQQAQQQMTPSDTAGGDLFDTEIPSETEGTPQDTSGK